MKLDNWMASVLESRWHIITREGGSPVALCGHRLRGPIRRIISAQPPQANDGRGSCPNCHHISVELSETPTDRNILLANILEDTIPWPQIDYDEPEAKGVPGSSYLPGTDDHPIPVAA